MPFIVNKIIAEKIMGLQVREKQIETKNGTTTVYDYFDENPNVAAIERKEHKRARFLQTMTGFEPGIFHVFLEKGARWKPVKDYISSLDLAMEVQEEMFRRGYYLALERRDNGEWMAEYLDNSTRTSSMCVSVRVSEAICYAACNVLHIAIERAVRATK